MVNVYERAKVLFAGVILHLRFYIYFMATNALQILGNDLLFFGDSTYLQDLVSLSEYVLKELNDVIQQEPSQVILGLNFCYGIKLLIYLLTCNLV